MLSVVDMYVFFFFFSSRRRHTRLQGDWSSDVCSSDLIVAGKLGACLVVIGALLAGTLVYPAWVYHVQPFSLEPLIAAYLGLVLFSLVCASYGLFVSSLTESQVLAGFLTALPLLALGERGD